MVTDFAVRGFCENLMEPEYFEERITLLCYSCINIDAIGRNTLKLGQLISQAFEKLE